MSRRKRDKSTKAAAPPVVAVTAPPVAWYWQLAALAILAASAIAAYSNSFSADFVFDGGSFIRDNPSIRQLWPFEMDRGRNRPVGFYSFALNYAAGGLNVWGYHAVNLAIHVIAAWLLFDIVRRTLASRRLAARYGDHAWGLGLATAFLWVLHPLQTESVTYVYQRLESQMGMLYLATLWCFLRAVGSPRRHYLWYAASVICCALGMGTKEVMVTCPLAVLWYDRVFVASSWREMLNRRGPYYLFLAGTWGVLATVVIRGWERYETSGILVQNFTPLDYALSQPEVILHYLQLVIWPHKLCVDYVWLVPIDSWRTVKSSLILAAIVAAVVWCMFRRPALGFLGGWFFLVLGPTSSVFPVRDLAVEHRMYLSLATPIVLAVILGYEICRDLGKGLPGKAARSPAAQLIPLTLLLLVGIALGWRTHVRNEDYQSSLALWSTTFEQRPSNLRARTNYSNALYFDAHDGKKAVKVLEGTMELAAQMGFKYARPYFLRGLIRQDAGQHELAVQDFSRAIEWEPKKSDGRTKRALSYRELGEFDRALADLDDVIEKNPNLPGYYLLRAQTHLQQGQYTGKKNTDAAIRDAQRACQLTGFRNVSCLETLAAAYAEHGDFRSAIEWQSKILELTDDQTARGAAQERLDLYRSGRAYRPAPKK